MRRGSVRGRGGPWACSRGAALLGAAPGGAAQGCAPPLSRTGRALRGRALGDASQRRTCRPPSPRARQVGKRLGPHWGGGGRGRAACPPPRGSRSQRLPGARAGLRPPPPSGRCSLVARRPGLPAGRLRPQRPLSTGLVAAPGRMGPFSAQKIFGGTSKILKVPQKILAPPKKMGQHTHFWNLVSSSFSRPQTLQAC